MKLAAALLASLVFLAQASTAQVLGDPVKCQEQTSTPRVCTVTIKPAASGDPCQATVPASVELTADNKVLRWRIDGEPTKLRFRRDQQQVAGVEYRTGGASFSPDSAEPETDWRTRRAVRDGKVKSDAYVWLNASGSNCPAAGPVIVNRD